MSNSPQVKYVPVGEGLKYFGPGDQLTFLITGAESGGLFFMAETLIAPGGGPPPHIHEREDETFYVLEGNPTFYAADKTIQGAPGSFIFLPRGIKHAFKNAAATPARMIVICTPAGIEKFFEATMEPARPGVLPPMLTPELIGRFLAEAPKYGLQLFPHG